MEVILSGKTGPLEVDGVQYNSVMPPMQHLSNEDVVSITAHVVNNSTDG